MTKKNKISFKSGHFKYRPRNNKKEQGRFNGLFLIATTLLTLAIAVSQSIIAYRQLEASKVSYYPFFIIKEKTSPSQFLKQSEDESIEIINTGFPIVNYQSEIKTYLNAMRLKGIHENIIAELYFPISYYSLNSVLSGGKDTLQTMTGIENKGQLDFLRNRIAEINLSGLLEGNRYDLSVVKTIKISYQDIQGTPHTQFFINQKSVSASEFAAFNDEINRKRAVRDKEGDSLPEDLEDFSADTIIKMLNKSSHESDIGRLPAEKTPDLIAVPSLSK